MEPAPGTESRRTAADDGDTPSGNGMSPLQELDALRQDLLEAGEQAGWYLRTRLDRVLLSFKQIVFAVVLGASALVVFVTLVITGALLVARGTADVMTAWLGPVYGRLTAGAVVLALVFLGIACIRAAVLAHSRRMTLERYRRRAEKEAEHAP